MRLTSSRAPDLSAAALMAALAIFEIVRLIVHGGVTPGHTMLSSLVNAIVVSTVLAVAAVGLFLHRSFGWLAGVFAFVLAAGYGVVLRAGGDPVGVLYMLASAVFFVLLAKSLRFYHADQLATR